MNLSSSGCTAQQTTTQETTSRFHSVQERAGAVAKVILYGGTAASADILQQFVSEERCRSLHNVRDVLALGPGRDEFYSPDQDQGLSQPFLFPFLCLSFATCNFRRGMLVTLCHIFCPSPLGQRQRSGHDMWTWLAVGFPNPSVGHDPDIHHGLPKHS